MEDLTPFERVTALRKEAHGRRVRFDLSPQGHTLHPGIDTHAHYRLQDGYHVRPLHIRRYGRGEQVVYIRTHQPDVQRKMGLQDWLCSAKPWPRA